MDKTVAGLLAAMGAAVASTSGQAATPGSVLSASSYADLLRPVSNPVETLKALDGEAGVQEVQYYYPPAYYVPPRLFGHHHHHHHNRYYRPRYHHHHHHHHHGYGDRG